MSMFLQFFTCIFLSHTVLAQYLGDSCRLQSTGEDGTCKLISDCPKVLDDIKKQIYPQTCGFQGTQPIVCCGQGSFRPMTTTTQRTTRTTPRRTTTTRPTRRPVDEKAPEPGRVGDKSWQKCQEYGKYIYIESPTTGSRNKRKDCQVAKVPLIVGGERAKLKEFPHMALIGYNNQGTKAWQCGGSLISEQYVLTAGHCLYHQEFGDAAYILLGELIIDDATDRAQTQEFTIVERIAPPTYTPAKRYDDIALLRLNRPADLSPYVRPLCLYTKPTFNVKRAIASGWGKTGYTSATSEVLLKVTLEFFTTQECNRTYSAQSDRRLKLGILEESQVCAGSHDEKKDTCQGDSGGPLQIFNDDVECMYYIVGVTSFGRSCGIANIPGIYTRVSNYIEWIESVVWP